MPSACSVDAQRLFTECPLDGQDRPPDGLLQNGLCDFIPNPACQSFFLFIVCICILYILEELVLKFWNFSLLNRLKAEFNDVSCDLWYFYDTSCKINEKISFLYCAVYQMFIRISYKIMILWYFFPQKTFMRRQLFSIHLSYYPAQVSQVLSHTPWRLKSSVR